MNKFKGSFQNEYYHDGEVGDLAIPEKNVIASTCEDSYIYLWDMKKNEQIKKIKAHDKVIETIIFQEPNRILTASDDCDIKIWSYPTFALEKVIHNAHQDVIVK